MEPLAVIGMIMVSLAERFKHKPQEDLSFESARRLRVGFAG